MKKKIQTLVLAAGRSSRFEDKTTKMLYDLDNSKILLRVLVNLERAGLENVNLVLGHQRQTILEEFTKEWSKDLKNDKYDIFVQIDQNGTGDAVKAARGLKLAPHTLVVFGDKPLFKPSTIKAFIDTHLNSKGILTCSTVDHPNPENYAEGYGTVVRDTTTGRVTALRKIDNCKECDAAMYLFNTEWLWQNIDRLKPHDNGRYKMEYFLPDLIEIAHSDGVLIGEYKVEDYRETTGINTLAHAEEAKEYLKQF